MATAGFAVLLFATSLLVSAHNHSPNNSEANHHCATCHLLPQGLQLLSSAPRLPLPLLATATKVFFTIVDPNLVSEHSARSIRGPPAA